MENPHWDKLADNFQGQPTLLTDLDQLSDLHQQLLSVFPEAGKLVKRPVPVGAALQGVSPDLARLQLQVLGQQMQHLLPYAKTNLGVIRVAAFYYLAFVRAAILSSGNQAIASFLTDLFIKERTARESKFEFSQYPYKGSYYERLAAMGWALHNLGPLSQAMAFDRGIEEPLAVYLPMPYRVDPVTHEKDLSEAYRGTLLDGAPVIGLTKISQGSPLVRRRWFAGFDWDDCLPRETFPRLLNFRAAEQIVNVAAELSPAEVAMNLRKIGELRPFNVDRDLEDLGYRYVFSEVFASVLCNMAAGDREKLLNRFMNLVLRQANPVPVDQSDFNRFFIDYLRAARDVSQTPLNAYRTTMGRTTGRGNSRMVRWKPV
jgi:hypothetical protein